MDLQTNAASNNSDNPDQNEIYSSMHNSSWSGTSHKVNTRPENAQEDRKSENLNSLLKWTNRQMLKVIIALSQIKMERTTQWTTLLKAVSIKMLMVNQ